MGISARKVAGRRRNRATGLLPFWELAREGYFRQITAEYLHEEIDRGRPRKF